MRPEDDEGPMTIPQRPEERGQVRHGFQSGARGLPEHIDKPLNAIAALTHDQVKDAREESRLHRLWIRETTEHALRVAVGGAAGCLVLLLAAGLAGLLVGAAYVAHLWG